MSAFFVPQVGSPISKTNIIHPHVYVSILLLSDYNLHKNVMLLFQIILWYNFVLNSFLNVIFSKSPGIWFFFNLYCRNVSVVTMLFMIMMYSFHHLYFYSFVFLLPSYESSPSFWHIISWIGFVWSPEHTSQEFKQTEHGWAHNT